MNNASPRFELLDHWRGVAALAVLLFHSSYPWLIQPAPPGFTWVSCLAAEGWRGVHLFFVISGYCIAQLALREVDSRRSFFAFLRNRMLRIFPCYWSACVLTVVIGLTSLPFNNAALFSSIESPGVIPSSLGAVLSNCLLLEPLLGQPSFLLVAWTLTWEVIFYLFAGALVLVAMLIGRPSAVTLGLFLAFVGAIPAAAHNFPPLGGWSEFTCGACLYGALLAKKTSRSPAMWIGLICSLGVVGLFLGGTQLPFAAAFSLLLLALHGHDHIIAQHRAGRWLAACGVVSYSVYLIHVPIVTASRGLLRRIIPSESTWFALVIVVAMSGALCAGFLFYRVVEAPFERWRRNLERRTSELRRI